MPPFATSLTSTLCAVRLDGEPFNIGIAATILPDRAEGIGPRLLDDKGEQSCLAGSATAIELTQNHLAKYVLGIWAGGSLKTIIAVHAHRDGAGRKREVGQNLRRLAIGRFHCS